jgi:hypothetical protein
LTFAGLAPASAKAQGRPNPAPFGTGKVIEGRGYEPDGWAELQCLRRGLFQPGHSGDFMIAPTADGYTWEIPAGSTTIRYAAVIEDGTLREVGDRIVPDREPQRFFEMTLQRVGDSDWPVAGAIGPK